MDKTLSQMIKEFEQEIPAAEMHDILMAILMLKKVSGWGKIEIIYANNDMTTIETTIKQKTPKDPRKS